MWFEYKGVVGGWPHTNASKNVAVGGDCFYHITQLIIHLLLSWKYHSTSSAVEECKAKCDPVNKEIFFIAHNKTM